MKINVTKEHIEQSIKILLTDQNAFRTYYCPLALAIKDAVGHTEVEVSLLSTTVKYKRHYLPPRALRFRKDFDENWRNDIVSAMEPFTFELPIEE